MSEFKKMRAAGYARVSTETELQEGSYELQVQYFRDMIMEDPNLEFVDVYGDKGISGRDAERRPGFLQMIQDCKDGKIDAFDLCMMRRSLEAKNLNCHMIINSESL